MNDELYQQWLEQRREAQPSEAFAESVMARARKTPVTPAPPVTQMSGGDERSRWRAAARWLDAHPLARAAVLVGAAAAGIGRIAALLALMLTGG